MRGLTDKQRVLRLALSRGERGFCAVDFQLPNVVDDGKPILRVAARVKELRDEGIRFDNGGTRNRCRVYVLDRQSLADATQPPKPGVASAAGPVPPPAGPADGAELFPREPEGPRNAIYGEEAA